MITRRPTWLQQVPGDLLGRGADVDEQRGVVGDVGGDQARDPPLLLDAQDLPVEIGDVLDRGGQGGTAVMPLQHGLRRTAR